MVSATHGAILAGTVRDLRLRLVLSFADAVVGALAVRSIDPLVKVGLAAIQPRRPLEAALPPPTSDAAER